MKKVKINLLAIIGLMVAVGTLAFTTPKSSINNLNDDPLWHYTELTSDEENNPEMYEPATGQESCPGTTEVVCLISAPAISDEDGERPDLDNAQTISLKF